ncbi:ABC transporter substrate-binding protein [Collinsella tanakaei]|uniref:ABC transporter substrate-binding protein n=2 Tax=Collinsella tanakaei TaxID=626935 RepID=UPI0025A33245|nr:ABC transporter substrate-binding protein [Collinsella tanakaei]MDM8301590.1 ABC transporter substrate-binding protein [Collinsella tanakaei]
MDRNMVVRAAIERGMSRRQFFAMLAGAAGLAATASIGLTGCSEGGEAVEEVDYNSMSLDEIIAQAQEEGEVNSVGMPDTWANWIETWEDLEAEYGIAHTDQDMSSAEEIAMFKQEGTDGTKDIGDVGQQWGPTAEEEGVTLKYKTSYWDEIPDWAKDDDGDWVVGYYGTMSFIANDEQVPSAPTSYQDILDGDYKVTIGDVVAGASSQYAVLAAAYALGGGIDDMQPAYDFLTQLAEAGRLDTGDPSIARLESGEIAVALHWDYNTMNYRAQILENNPDASFTVTIPQDASVRSGYCTIINKYAPHPAAACLAREYILSDEGQINLARGFATPIRDVELPEDVKALHLDDSAYGDNVVDVDNDKWTGVCEELITWYQENIIPMIG